MVATSTPEWHQESPQTLQCYIQTNVALSIQQWSVKGNSCGHLTFFFLLCHDTNNTNTACLFIYYCKESLILPSFSMRIFIMGPIIIYSNHKTKERVEIWKMNRVEMLGLVLRYYLTKYSFYIPSINLLEIFWNDRKFFTWTLF